MPLPVLPSHPACTLCPLSSAGILHPGIAGRHVPESLPPSPTTPLIYFLGQNPGHNEDRANSPFVGASGRLVTEGMILPLSLHTLASIYLSNAVRCHTHDNAKPTAKSQKACFPHTLAELALLPHSRLYIVCLGETATSSLFKYGLGRSKITQSDALSLNLEPFTLGTTPFIHISTYHPAYTFRNPNISLTIDTHMRLLSDHLRGLAATRSSPTLIPPRAPIP